MENRQKYGQVGGMTVIMSDSADTSKKYLFRVVEDDEKPFVRWVTVWPAVNCARQRVNGTQMHLIKPECADSELNLKHSHAADI